MEVKQVKKDVKLYIVNNDVDIYEWYFIDNLKTFQVEITGKSGKRYIVANFGTMKEAKEFVKRIGALQ